MDSRMNHKHLRHIDLKYHYQFVTFRTFDSVDSYIKKLSSYTSNCRKRQLAIDTYLDKSSNGAYLNDDALLYLRELLIAQDHKLYQLFAFCIMPNHVHILCEPLVKLSLIMQIIKGRSAKKINTMGKNNGCFWEPDYYDRLIRSEHHFRVVYRYIRQNPLVLDETEGSPPRFYGIYD